MNRRELLAASACCAALDFAQAQTAQAPVAIDWPPIELLDGRTIAPSSWQGLPSVVVFWATWCPFCKRHNAHVDKLWRAVQGGKSSLRVLGVAQDRDPQLVRRYMEQNGYAFPVALDTMGLRARLTNRKVIPLTCVIDREGRLAQAIAGEMFEEDVLAFTQLATARADKT